MVDYAGKGLVPITDFIDKGKYLALYNKLIEIIKELGVDKTQTKDSRAKFGIQAVSFIYQGDHGDNKNMLSWKITASMDNDSFAFWDTLNRLIQFDNKNGYAKLDLPYSTGNYNILLLQFIIAESKY